MQRLAHLFLALCLVTLSGNAIAHAFLDQATPGAGTKLDRAPGTVVLRFSALLEPLFSSIHVEDADGQRLGPARAGIDPQDGHIMRLPLPPLPPGTYRVVWHATARDGHPTKGEYIFSIR